jgi:hypothetical protein
LTAEVGDELKLFCNASGLPKPDIKWTKQTLDVIGDVIDETPIEGDVDDARYLLIPKIANPTQRYVCTASNPLGSAKLLFNINVKGSQKQRIVHLYLCCCCLSIQNWEEFNKLRKDKKWGN